MGIPTPTVEELIATLCKTTLPTILVEGTGDVRIYRRLEESIEDLGGNILICHGRKALLAIFERRSEITSPALAFLADKDLWLYDRIPEKYDQVIWTEGYSIENDIYEGSSVERLLQEPEKRTFSMLLDKICLWYAFELEEASHGRTSQHALGVGRILNHERNDLCSAFLAERGFCQPKAETVRSIRESYGLKLRGKTLYSLLSQLLSAKDRAAKFSMAALIEVSLTTGKKPRLPSEIGRQNTE